MDLTFAGLDPIAQHLLQAHSDTTEYSAWFRSRHDGDPPTSHSKVQHLRSDLQHRVRDDDRFLLGPDYVETGRVLIEDPLSQTQLLLRSLAAFKIERATKGNFQVESLFAEPVLLASPVKLLVYDFGPFGLDLSVTGAAHRAGRRRLVATGNPTLVGTWPYHPSPSTAQGSFAQGVDDAFDELGSIDLEATGDEE